MSGFLVIYDGADYNLSYQIFIEPKGLQFAGPGEDFTKGPEAWKQKFLKDISKKYGGKNKEPVLRIENQQYIIVGLPFYNQRKQGLYKRLA